MSTSENSSEFKTNLLSESKLNREFEKKFVRNVQSTIIFYLDSKPTLKEVEDDLYKQSSLLTNFKFSLITEIEDNLLFLQKNQAEIYLDKLNLKMRSLQETLNEEEKNINTTGLVSFIGYEDFKNKELQQILENIKFSIQSKRRAIDSVLKIIDTNIVFYSNGANKLKWIAKPSQLGFVIGMLADLEYLDVPRRQNGDINYTQFANLVNQTFDVETTSATLSKYLNLDSEKAQETYRKFKDAGFNIPHKNIVS